jgi:hypothetical protein
MLARVSIRVSAWWQVVFGVTCAGLPALTSSAEKPESAQGLVFQSTLKKPTRLLGLMQNSIRPDLWLS